MRTETIDALTAYAREHPDVMLLTADLGYSVLERFAEALPGQYANVGVCEQAMAGIAAGLALSGRRLVIYSIANFPTLRCLEQLRNVPFAGWIIDLSADLDRGPDAFLDTAAVIAGLDLVISTDTAVAHLAGALGRPVWTVLAASPEWRWGLERSDSPWYPTMRLFRQTTDGDWNAVVAAIAEALQDLSASA